MRFGLLSQLCVATTIILLNEQTMAIGPPHRPLSNGTFIDVSTPEECTRECRDDEPPKTCYYHFTLENYNVLGGACKLCTPNDTNAIKSECQCVQADGVERGILTVNRMIPGPSIQVCEGDKLVIDVQNHMSGMEASIHWHGVFQKGFQYYDGVPLLTQCPIPESTSFRYQWVANNAGTHFWHSHEGLQRIDGLYGSLIIRQSPNKEPHIQLYDKDLADHVILISDWTHEYSLETFPGLLTPGKTGQAAQNVLINGKGQFTDPATGNTTDTPLEVFTIKSGLRYRFRLINSFSTVCPANITFEGHNLTLIATDGEAVTPVQVNTIVSFSGERYDFIINADQPVGAYWIQLRAIGECGVNRVQNLGILRYKNATQEPTSDAPSYDEGLPLGVVLNPIDSSCHTQREDAICVNQLKSAKAVDSGILKENADLKFYLPFKFYAYAPEQVFKPGTYNRYLVPSTGQPLISLVNGISFTFPPSPPLSQIQDIPAGQFCNGDEKPADCGDNCSCTHTLDIPLHKIVEIVFFDQVPGTNLSHPFHLHGYAFSVIGMGRLPETNRFDLKKAIDMDRQGLLNRTFDLPPSKDTIAVPHGGYVIIRFRADNPGYWLFHCHFSVHLAVGMGVVLHVGDQHDLPPVPRGFPTCGDFLPPIRYQSSIVDNEVDLLNPADPGDQIK